MIFFCDTKERKYECTYDIGKNARKYTRTGNQDEHQDNPKPIIHIYKKYKSQIDHDYENVLFCEFGQGSTMTIGPIQLDLRHNEY